eukprot:13432-Heterococcus_DN1.PRE.3
MFVCRIIVQCSTLAADLAVSMHVKHIKYQTECVGQRFAYTTAAAAAAAANITRCTFLYKQPEIAEQLVQLSIVSSAMLKSTPRAWPESVCVAFTEAAEVDCHQTTAGLPVTALPVLVAATAMLLRAVNRCTKICSHSLAMKSSAAQIACVIAAVGAAALYRTRSVQQKPEEHALSCEGGVGSDVEVAASTNVMHNPYLVQSIIDFVGPGQHQQHNIGRKGTHRSQLVKLAI